MDISEVLKLIESEPLGVFTQRKVEAIAPMNLIDDTYLVVVNTGSPVTPYVRWYYRADKDAHGFYWGHYFETINEAIEDFKETLRTKID